MAIDCDVFAARFAAAFTCCALVASMVAIETVVGLATDAVPAGFPIVDETLADARAAAACAAVEAVAAAPAVALAEEAVPFPATVCVPVDFADFGGTFAGVVWPPVDSIPARAAEALVSGSADAPWLLEERVWDEGPFGPFPALVSMSTIPSGA